MSPKILRITTRNARSQEWQALLANRRKRQRSGEFIVQGVRPVTLAIRHGWSIRALIYDGDRPQSAWAECGPAEHPKSPWPGSCSVSWARRPARCRS